MGPAPKVTKVERFFLKDVAAFVRASHGDVAKFLRSRQLLRRQTFAARRARYWTTARGVALAVAHFRAILGKKYEQGDDRLAVADRIKARALLKKTG